MAEIIKSGILTSDETWTAGTYRLTGDVILNGNSLTLDCSDGNIVIKSDNGVYGLLINNGGETIQTVNTSNTRKVIFTSPNDNSHGETITGSTGIPSRIDQSVPYIRAENAAIFAAPVTIKLQYIECWYNTNDKGCISWSVGFGPGGLSISVNIDRCILKCCGIPDSASGPCGLIGMQSSSAAHDYGEFTLQNITIDSSNSIESATAFAINVGGHITGDITASIYSCWIAPKNTVAALGAIGFDGFRKPIDICNVFIGGNLQRGISICHHTGASITVRSCLMYNPWPISVWITSGVYINAVSNTECQVYNCIFNRFFSTAGAPMFGNNMVTFKEHNNGFNSCTMYVVIDFIEQGYDITDILADPDLNLMPEYASITSDCAFLDGYVVHNLDDYLFNGYDTLASQGFDYTKHTATGEKYAATDKMTPGILYEASWASDDIYDTIIDVLRPEPNWKFPIEIDYEYRTVISIARRNKEQRRPLITRPIRKIKFTLTEYTRRWWYENFYRANKGSKYYIPVYSEPIRPLNIGSLLGVSKIIGNGFLTLFNLSVLTERVVLYSIDDEIKPEIHELSSLSDCELNLSEPINGDFMSEKTVIYPLMLASIVNIKTDNITNRIGHINIEFIEEL